MIVTMETPDRLLSLAGAYNFRDLGRYPTTDGRMTVWGKLFRSDTLQELTGADLDVLRRIGLAGVIDLRTTAEVERSGRGPLAHEPVRYLHASVLQDEGGESQAAPSGDDPSERYLWYLDAGRHALVAALEMVADPDSYPLVFHCAAGKDRTGVLAALVLDILAVRTEVIVEDYVLTETRIDLIRARLRRDPVYGDQIDQIPASRLSVQATTMECFLSELHARHGGARDWALAAGVAEASLDRMSAFLLEPAP
jgi:protein tyrosine/serine phosphatase